MLLSELLLVLLGEELLVHAGEVEPVAGQGLANPVALDAMHRIAKAVNNYPPHIQVS